MNLIRILLFIAALVTVVITSDDILSEQRVNESLARLNAPANIDALIREVYAPAYDGLESLRQDYPDFTPAFTQASERRSAYLHSLGLVDTLATFSVQLPDTRMTVDMQGKVLLREQCGMAPGDCPVVRPASTEFGLVAELYFQPSEDVSKIPALDYYASWENGGQVETRENCFWSYTPDVSRDQFTLQSTLNRYEPYEPKGIYGFYAVEFNFILDGDRAPLPPHQYGKFTRISRADFFARKGCNHLGEVY